MPVGRWDPNLQAHVDDASGTVWSPEAKAWVAPSGYVWKGGKAIAPGSPDHPGDQVIKSALSVASKLPKMSSLGVQRASSGVGMPGGNANLDALARTVGTKFGSGSPALPGSPGGSLLGAPPALPGAPPGGPGRGPGDFSFGTIASMLGGS